MFDDREDILEASEGNCENSLCMSSKSARASEKLGNLSDKLGLLESKDLLEKKESLSIIPNWSRKLDCLLGKSSLSLLVLSKEVDLLLSSEIWDRVEELLCLEASDFDDILDCSDIRDLSEVLDRPDILEPTESVDLWDMRECPRPIKLLRSPKSEEKPTLKKGSSKASMELPVEENVLWELVEVLLFLTDILEPSGRSLMQDSLTSEASAFSASLNLPAGSSFRRWILVTASRRADCPSFSSTSAVTSWDSIRPSFSWMTFDRSAFTVRLPSFSSTVTVLSPTDPHPGVNVGTLVTGDMKMDEELGRGYISLLSIDRRSLLEGVGVLFSNWVMFSDDAWEQGRSLVSLDLFFSTASTLKETSERCLLLFLFRLLPTSNSIVVDTLETSDWASLGTGEEQEELLTEDSPDSLIIKRSLTSLGRLSRPLSQDSKLEEDCSVFEPPLLKEEAVEDEVLLKDLVECPSAFICSS